MKTVKSLLRLRAGPALVAVSFAFSNACIAQTDDEAFDAALAEMTIAYFQHVPEAATTVGLSDDIVPGTSVRLLDRSVAGNQARNRALESSLQSMQSVRSEFLSPDRKYTHALVTMLFDGALEPSRVVDYGTTAGDWQFWFLPYPIVQNSGPTVEIPRTLTSLQAVTQPVEAEAYITRLAAASDSLDGALESYRRGVQLGAIPPDFIIGKSLAVVEAFIETGAGRNPLFLGFVEKLAAAGIDNADDYADRALRIIDEDVIPAYQRIADYMVEIKVSAPHDAGIWRLPNGEALYAAMIYHMTDSKLSVDDIHQTGLDEVDRVTREMDEILRSEGYKKGSVGERMQQLSVEPRFIYANNADGKKQLLADIRKDIDDMYEKLPDWFLLVPEHKVEVRAVPEFSEDSAAGGYYMSPTPDGSRPGYYFINLRDTAELPSFTLPTLTYHEAVPGHHLDGATAVSQARPILATALYSNASGEGWGLYAEQLAAEMGAYVDDPYGDLGRLQAELHRSVRLVVDTGMHAKRWSREKAIDYMITVEGLDEASVISEVERYAVGPGQALGYKLGQLKILALREEAQKALGKDFNIREFNQEVLDVAAAPLPYIEATIRDWIVASGTR